MSIDMSTIQKGQIVYYVINTGITGIMRYQYIGIVKDAFTQENRHVFLSEYMVSTATFPVGKESNYRAHRMFLKESDAKNRQAEMSKEEDTELNNYY